MKLLITLVLLGSSLVYAAAPESAAPVAAEPARLDAPAPDGIRPGGTLNQSLPAPVIAPEVVDGKKSVRNYPDQPPTIPHNIRDYQIDKNFNKCLTCHSRSQSAATGAPMVSITHYWDREGQALGAVSPRRYFCLACHVPQAQTEPLVPSQFKTMDEALQPKAQSIPPASQP